MRVNKKKYVACPNRITTTGVFAMEGDEHKLQRRVITPAFTTQAIKAMMPVFLQKAEELRECWEREVDAPHPSPLTAFFASLVPPHMQLLPPTEKKSQAQVIEISHWLIRATFDVIGLAGFDYDFHSLKNETESVYRAYRQMFSLQEEGPGYGAILRLYFPILDKFWVGLAIFLLLPPNHHHRHHYLYPISRLSRCLALFLFYSPVPDVFLFRLSNFVYAT
jgi:hypothetical protein